MFAFGAARVPGALLTGVHSDWGSPGAGALPSRQELQSRLNEPAGHSLESLNLCQEVVLRSANSVETLLECRSSSGSDDPITSEPSWPESLLSNSDM